MITILKVPLNTQDFHKISWSWYDIFSEISSIDLPVLHPGYSCFTRRYHDIQWLSNIQIEKLQCIHAVNKWEWGLESKVKILLQYLQSAWIVWLPYTLARVWSKFHHIFQGRMGNWQESYIYMHVLDILTQQWCIRFVLALAHQWCFRCVHIGTPVTHTAHVHTSAHQWGTWLMFTLTHQWCLWLDVMTGFCAFHLFLYKTYVKIICWYCSEPLWHPYNFAIHTHHSIFCEI